MKRSISSVLVAALAFAGAVDARTPVEATAAGTRVLSETLARGTTLDVENVRGAIVARAVSGNVATVDARIESDRTPAGAHVAVERSAGRVRVCTVFGDAPADTCESQHDERNDDRVRVTYTVGLPAGVTFAARSVDGAVTVRGARAPVSVSTVQGDVAIESDANVTASTVQGTIDAIQHAARGSACDLHTVNGNIALRLPRSAGATINAQTLSGGIAGDPALGLSDRSGSIVGHHATAKLGDGAVAVSLETVSGSIHVSLH